MSIIAFINQKGGVGKTTTTLHLGAYLARNGLRVLLMDLDPQTDLSKSIGYYNSDNNIINFFEATCENEVSPIEVERNLFLIPGYHDLEEIKLTRFLLKQKLQLVKENFDYILIDCQPQKIVKSKLTINEVVLSATDFLMIPLDANTNSVTGTDDFMNSIERIKFSFNENLKILGIFFTIVDVRERIFKEYYEYLQEKNPDLLFKSFIRKDTKLKQAQAVGITIFEFDKKSRASIDFTNFGKEFINKINKH